MTLTNETAQSLVDEQRRLTSRTLEVTILLFELQAKCNHTFNLDYRDNVCEKCGHVIPSPMFGVETD